MAWGAPAPGKLANYCVFEWIGGGAGPTDADFGRLQEDVGPAVSVGPDCPQLVPHGGSSLTEQNWAALRTSFRERTGALGPLVPGSPHANRPRIAVIDSWPTATAPGWTTAAAGLSAASRDHGFTIARLMQELLCHGGICVADVHSFQALSLDSTKLIANGPGAYGRLSDLATAIYKAARHEDQPTGDSARWAILNLSVAWSPGTPAGGALGAIEAGESAPAAAVHEVLEYAACRGMLAVAATGNDLGGTADDEDPAFPAAWNGMTAPSASECWQQFQITATSAGGPLIQAVGGVTPSGSPLGISRAHAEPALVADAIHAVAHRDPNGTTHTRVMTGTSVAAAVVSAAAAAAAYNTPGLDRRNLIDELYNTGRDLGRSSQLQFGGYTAVRQVSVCRAYGASCAVCPAACGTPASVPAMVAAGVTRVPGGTMSQCLAPDTTGGPMAICGSASTSIDEMPINFPQPGEIGCWVCYADLNGTEIYLDVAVSGTMRLDWVTFHDDTGSTESLDLSAGNYTFSSTIAGATTVQTVHVSGLPAPASLTPTRGTVFFVLEDDLGHPIGTTSGELAVY